MAIRTGFLREHEDVIHNLQRLADIVWIVATRYFVSWQYGQIWRREDTNVTLLAAIVFSLAGQICNLYRGWRIERLGIEMRMVVLTWLATVGVLVGAGVATKTSADYSRVVSFGWFTTLPVVLCAWRLLVRGFLRMLRTNGRNIRRAAVLGATPSARELIDQIQEHPWMGMQIAGVYDDRAPGRRTELPCPFLGGSKDLIATCHRNLIDAVYVALPLRAEPRIAQVMADLSDTTVTVYLVADFFMYDLLSAHWSSIGSVPLISVHDTPFQGLNAWLKRIEDLVLGSMILLIIAVPLVIVALLIKLTSRGPVLFRQRRYGLNGKEIRILKFRTMTVCEDGPEIRQATRDDARVTRLGAFLRRTSLDELPQFLQVITGEMSIVGPRPHAVAHNESYRAQIRGYMLRHKVKPGITGWAQVNGWRGETPDVKWMERRVEHDLEYIQRWTVLWDLKIILLTILGRKKSQNAY